jgi:hypothetical protein
MSDATYTLFRGTATTSTSTVLFTTPTDLAVSVDNIVVTNTTTSDRTYSLALGGFAIAQGTTIPASSTHYIDLLQIIYNGETIVGSASATSSVNFHIAGSDVV